MADAQFSLQTHYDRLWESARPHIQAGEVECDPHLSGERLDERRGLTLLLRPPAEVAGAISAFLAECAGVEPGQYVYQAAELHVTVLSLFTATAQYQPRYARSADYLTAGDAAIEGAAPLQVAFRGITASPGAVLIQGFPADEGLEELRERLRQGLRAAGLDSGLDQRYRIRTAHITALRFRSPLRDPATFCALLDRYRGRDFGAATVAQAELVANDWYMSAAHTRLLRRYTLGGDNDI